MPCSFSIVAIVWPLLCVIRPATKAEPFHSAVSLMELTGVACLPVYAVKWSGPSPWWAGSASGMVTSHRWLATKEYIAVPESVYGTGVWTVASTMLPWLQEEDSHAPRMSFLCKRDYITRRRGRGSPPHWSVLSSYTHRYIPKQRCAHRKTCRSTHRYIHT